MPVPTGPFVVDMSQLAQAEALKPRAVSNNAPRQEDESSDEESIYTKKQISAFLERARNMPVQGGIDYKQTVPHEPAGGGQTFNVLKSFESVDATRCCTDYGDILVPTDSHMIVGQNHIVVAVNSSVTIYSKTGQIVIPTVSAEAFYRVTDYCEGPFDPSGDYDEEADRYVLTYVGKDYGRYCIAVSQTGDPTGRWNLYAIDPRVPGTPMENFDYQHTAITSTHLVVGANIFNRGAGFKTARVYALNKQRAYDGLLLTPPTTKDLPGGDAVAGIEPFAAARSRRLFRRGETRRRGQCLHALAVEQPFRCDHHAGPGRHQPARCRSGSGVSAAPFPARHGLPA